MNTKLPDDPQFNKYYTKHCKYFKLKGLQPKTIEAYARAIRRIGNYFDTQLDHLTSDQLLDYFNDLLQSHSWSTVKLDLYGLKFFYTNVFRKTCGSRGRSSDYKLLKGFRFFPYNWAAFYATPYAFCVAYKLII